MSFGTVTIPGSNGQRIVAAPEDKREAIVHEDLVSTIVV